MPFTLVHPAVAAPLARRGLILSAVAIGSMAPDFEYYLRLSFATRWAHTVAAIPIFTLPASLIGLWVFHNLLKAALIRLLPPAHRRRLACFDAPFTFGPWRHFLLVVLSCLAGIGTHLLFDAFTHEEGYVAQQWPLLHIPLVQTSFYTMRLCEVLQFSLTFLFLLIILVQYRHWLAKHPEPAALMPPWSELHPQLPSWLALGSTALVVALLYAHLRIPHIDSVPTFRTFSGYAILAGLSAFVVELAIVGRLFNRTLVATRRN